MELDVRPGDTGVLLVVRGQMTGDDASNLGQKLEELLRDGYRDFLLDLEVVPYVDSAGLGEIVRLYSAITRQGGSLKLLNLSSLIENILWRR